MEVISMKIIKAHKSKEGHLQLMVDSIPKITYEKVGMSYIGSDENNYFSDYLRYEHGSGHFVAFAGREIKIELKDGTIETLKDHWWASSIKNEEHEFVYVGLGTMEELQDCFVFCSYRLRKDMLELAIKEYLKEDFYYEYYDIEKWAKLQYSWYPLIFHGRELPFLMNYKGNIIDAITKERKFALNNYMKIKKTRTFMLKLFKLQYRDNDRLIKLEDNYTNVVRETLPCNEFEKYRLKADKQ